MTDSISEIPKQELHLSLILRADGTTPYLSRWLDQRGPLPSSVLAQLAEAGLRAGHGADPAQILMRPVQGRRDQRQGFGTRVRARLVLHPLCHPLLIGHLQTMPDELHRRSVLCAIEAGLQWVVHVWKSGGSVCMPIEPAILVQPPVDAAGIMAIKQPEASSTPDPIPPMPDAPKEPEVLAPSVALPASPAPASPRRPDGLLDLDSLATLFPKYD